MKAAALKLFVAAAFLSLHLAASTPQLLSPYPPACKIDRNTTVFLLDDAALSNDDLLTVNAMQGLLARNCETSQLYRLNGQQSSPKVLLQAMLEGNSLLSTNTSFVGVAAPLQGLLHFCGPSRFKDGFVVAALGNESVNAALTFASFKDVAVVTSVNEGTALAAGLTKAADLTSSTVLDVLGSLNGSSTSPVLSNRVAVLQNPSKVCCLGDYSVYARAAHFFDDDVSTAPTSQQILDSLQAAGPAFAVLGWGTTELQTVAGISKRGGTVNAADWARNLATLSALGVSDAAAPKTKVSSTVDEGTASAAEGKAKEKVVKEEADAVHTVCFLFTDGDNLQWLNQDFLTDPSFWASPYRGSFPLGWTISPAVLDVMPAFWRYLTSTATANDGFVAAPSGFGYSYPDLMTSSQVQAFSSATSSFLNRTNSAAAMRIVNILGENYSQQAAAAMLSDPAVDALLWYLYSNYAGLNGAISFVGGKPVIAPRWQLWSGTFDDPASLTQKLLAAPKDPSSSSGYSLIDVHVWSDNATSVNEVVQALNAKGGFRVVTPTEFVSLIKANLG